jgi:hypothetical protein
MEGQTGAVHQSKGKQEEEREEEEEGQGEGEGKSGWSRRLHQLKSCTHPRKPGVVTGM